MSSDAFDSPARSFVPLTLQETLTKPQRTLSSRAARPSHAPSLPGPVSKSRADNARRDAAALCETLGIDATPRPVVRTVEGREGREEEKGREEEVMRLRAALGDKEGEVGALRRQLALVQKENGELRKAEKEGRGGRGGAGLGAREMEELAKSFEAQERLLAGYQKDSERSHQMNEALKSKQRKLTDHLEKVYGPSWESELSLQSTSFLPDPHASPALRERLTGRPSMSTPTSLRIHKGSSSSLSDAEVVESPRGTSPSSSPVLPSPILARDAVSREALKAQLDSVQALMRGVERRLISREVELDAVEMRAREEARKAEERAAEVEEMVRRGSCVKL